MTLEEEIRVFLYQAQVSQDWDGRLRTLVSLCLSRTIWLLTVQEGFISTCNEYSHFMLLPSFYVLNRFVPFKP